MSGKSLGYYARLSFEFSYSPPSLNGAEATKWSPISGNIFWGGR